MTNSFKERYDLMMRSLNNSKLLLTFIPLSIIIVFSAYVIFNETFADTYYKAIMVLAVFSLFCLLEIGFFIFLRDDLHRVWLFSITSNALTTFIYCIFYTKYLDYSNFIFSYKFLRIYDLGLKGASVCYYKVQTYWIERITILIILTFVIKFIAYMILKMNYHRDFKLHVFAFYAIVLFFYLCFSKYFTSVYRNVEVYYKEELYDQITYDEIRQLICAYLKKGSRDLLEDSLNNHKMVYNIPDNTFSSILNLFVKNTKDTAEINLRKKEFEANLKYITD